MKKPFQSLAAIAAFACLSCAVHPAPGAVTEAWVQGFTTMGNSSNDKAVKIVRDAAGDIIVTGDSDDGVNGFDMLTIKYSRADGSVLWQRRCNNPAGGPVNADEVRALAVDGQGDVVVTGRTRHDGQGVNSYTAKCAAANDTLLWAPHPVTATISGGNMIFTFARDDSSETPDVPVTVETSTDLLNWPQVIPAIFFIGSNSTDSSAGVTISENAAAPDLITVAIPFAGAKTKFARLKVSITP